MNWDIDELFVNMNWLTIISNINDSIDIISPLAFVDFVDLSTFSSNLT